MATVKHTVAKGETLSSIASKYKTTVGNLVKLNNIKNPNRIYIGQVLYISGKPSGSSSSSSSSGSTSAPRTATIIHAGIQANTQNTAYACWTWSRGNTEKYIYEWDYTSNGEIWFMGTHSEVSADTTITKDSVYTVPENAVLVRFRVKPISKTKKVNDKDVEYWKADWTGFRIIDPDVSAAPPKPNVPTIKIEKYKLTARLENLEENISMVSFNLMSDDPDVIISSTHIPVTPSLRAAEAYFNIEAGMRYKVRARVKRNSYWSPFSDDTQFFYATPGAPIIESCKAASKTSISLSWSVVKTANSYSIEYSTKKEWLEGSNATTVINDIKVNRYEITGLEPGNTYYFRVSAKNETGESEWSSIESSILGTKPEAPTTWSTTTTAIVGEDVVLYWVQNSEDKSRERKAELEIDINGDMTTHTIEKEINEDEKEVTSQYILKTDTLNEGVVIKWRVRTAGVTLEYGEWSIQRTINVYAPPIINTRLIDRTSGDLTILDSFPFYIESKFGPATQKPLTYHISIISNGSYTTVDEVGNVQNVVEGDEIMSKFYDPNIGRIEISPADVDLNTGIRYSVITTVAMDSGLTANATNDFEVSWVDDIYNPNAEIAINRDNISCSINPYCDYYPDVYYEAIYSDVDNTWSTTDKVLPIIEGISVDNAFTENGDIVYAGMYNGELTHYCVIQSREPVLVDNVYLSVYRKETDGRYILIADGIKNDGSVFVLDPHPALDYARYRIVARSYSTGSVSYTDLPPIPILEPGIILQWNEVLSTFNPTENLIQQPDWSGSMLRLKYNVDISDSNDMDVVFVEYIGRTDPVSYYGTQVGTKSKWTTDIPATDTETLSALRKLSRWFGDVYVRESSGTGYWANIDITFTKTHREVIIPVTISVTKVDGGV